MESYLDAVFGNCRRWRAFRGGAWFLVREEMHPAVEYWSRFPPDAEPWETLVKAEHYAVRK